MLLLDVFLVCSGSWPLNHDPLSHLCTDGNARAFDINDDVSAKRCYYHNGSANNKPKVFKVLSHFPAPAYLSYRIFLADLGKT